MIEGVDYFPIVDACRTELIPESPQGTLTCDLWRQRRLMKLGKIFICINILVLSLLMLKWPRIIYQNTSYRFDEYNRTIVLDGDIAE